ncbi:MAG: HNH endonuclease signature motif containing protein [Aeromicrobium sp.]
MIARHRGQYGNWCPGYRRDAHPARDLTVDHVVPLAAGGPSLDIANCAVLCRSCNSTKGASEPDRGYPHASSAAPGRPRPPFVCTRPSFARNPGL